MSTPALELTDHAALRLAQRGFRSGDLEWVMAIGSEVEGGFLVKEKDFLAVEHAVKRRLQRLRQLVGKRVVIEGDSIVTAYHAKPEKARRLLKRQ